MTTEGNGLNNVDPGAPGPGLIRYGEAALADVLPATLAALGVPGEPDPFGLPGTDCVVVLLVDGLGWNLLREHAGMAPFLSGLAGRALTAGFPTTTAASITSLGTGAPTGAHGIVGYTTRAGELSEPANWLTWRGASSARDLTADFPPELVQPLPTAFERAEAAGVRATVVSAPLFRESGLTRAALRGATYVPAFTAADTATLVADAARTRRGLVYCYIADLDLIGHIHGCRSDAWPVQLQLIDRGAELLAERLPADTQLLITADHGMLDVPESAKIDYDDEPTLHEGVELLAGEARVRYVHVRTGELDAVRRRWTERLAGRASVLTRDEAVARGWFGPVVTEAARARIGDLVVLADDDGALVRRRAESRAAGLVGHHGGLSPDELLVPLLSSR